MSAPASFAISVDPSVTISPLIDLNADQATLFAAFKRLNLQTTTYDHMPVFTVAESDFLKDTIPGTHGKSLLLTNKTGQVWMVSAADETKIDLKYLSDTLGTPRFSFAKPEVMTTLLHVTPGSLTPFAALFDTTCQVTVILDAYLMQQDTCVFHPLINRQSTVMHTADLLRFLQDCGHAPRVMTLAPAA
jgi:Ala-tRNA(Pro) deacylase